MPQILGRGVIKADGNVLASDVDFTLDLGGTGRQAETDASGNVYFRATSNASRLQFNLLTTPGTSLKSIQAMTNNTWSVEADTGQIWTIPGGWSGEVPSVSGSNGRTRITVQGGEVQEIVG